MAEQNFWYRLDRAARATLPVLSIIAAMILLGIPDLFPAAASLRDTLVVMSVYFWTLYRPGALPAPITVLLGLLLGLLADAPLGLWPVLLLLDQAAILAFRRVLVRQGFLVVWPVFIACLLATSVVEYSALCMLDLRLLPVAPMLPQIIFGTMLYPVFAPLLVRAHRGPAAPELA